MCCCSLECGGNFDDLGASRQTMDEQCPSREGIHTPSTHPSTHTFLKSFENIIRSIDNDKHELGVTGGRHEGGGRGPVSQNEASPRPSR